jgi:hypothetical protein
MCFCAVRTGATLGVDLYQLEASEFSFESCNWKMPFYKYMSLEPKQQPLAEAVTKLHRYDLE